MSQHCVSSRRRKKNSADVGKKRKPREVLDPEEAAAVRKSFAGLWSLGPDGEDDEDTRRAIEDAIRNPDAYVIKPQREGGGNNIYGKDVRAMLEDAGASDLSAYILMQRIRPARGKSVLVKGGSALEGDVISELGIYSVFLGNGDSVVLSTPAGHLLRTKLDGVDEGGVATGFSVLDSPCLV